MVTHDENPIALPGLPIKGTGAGMGHENPRRVPLLARHLAAMPCLVRDLNIALLLHF